MRKRFMLSAAVLATTALLGAACSSGHSDSGSNDGAGQGSGSDPVTISLESYMPSLGAAGVATLNGLVKSFEAAHPTIHVKIVSDATGSTSSLSAAYQREAATGSLPDVGQVIFDTLRFAVRSLGAQDLDKTYGTGAVQAEFGGQYPYAPAVSKLAVVDRHTYGIPWTLSTPVLFYNPELFQKAGLDPSKAPSTWDEVVQDSAAIKSKTGAAAINIGCFGESASGSDWCLQAILASNGGSVLSDDGTHTTFDSPQNIAAVTTMRQLAAGGGMVDLTSAQAVQEFATGKLAMILNSSALQTSLLTASSKSFAMKDGPMPGFAGHPATPTNSGSTLMVFTKDKAKQQAAWKLIQFLTSPQSETTITEKIGYPPLRTSLVNDPSYLKPFADKEPLIAANIGQLNKLIPWQSYPGSNFLQIETLLGDAVSKAVFQGKDVAQTLKGAQSQASGLVR